VIIPPSNVVDVMINGAMARMIVDTGATIVSVTPEMAARARINPDTTDLIDIKTVGGLMKHAAGYARLIKVGDATAANVPVTIAVNSKDAFGSGIDGLLGMSFLSRFVATVSPGLFELKPRSRT
jgi:clan AA aspartic protease (TIGR02281 family)